MENRSVRWIGLAILIVLGFMALQPYIQDRLYSASTPRPVEPRGSLSDYEKSTIEIFQTVCPFPTRGDSPSMLLRGLPGWAGQSLKQGG